MDKEEDQTGVDGMNTVVLGLLMGVAIVTFFGYLWWYEKGNWGLLVYIIGVGVIIMLGFASNIISRICSGDICPFEPCLIYWYNVCVVR